ncbi:MAG: outer membrane protein assembly factor BamD [Phycisphaeraceae bacterium]|nr:outer membrane protein assembly factor BamD [Phycisphaeraceae bacterium]
MNPSVAAPAAVPTAPKVARTRGRVRVAVALLLGVVGFAAQAMAQATEYVQDESGQWVEVAMKEPPSAALDTVNQARRLIADEKFGEAKKILEEWVEENKRGKSPLLPQAYLLLGDAKTGDGNEFEALYDYEAICKQFPDSIEYVKAVERELDIGVRYVNGFKRKFLGMRILDADDIGQELLLRVQERLPGSRLAERAGIELADYYFRVRDMSNAATAYRLFLQNYPKSEYAEKAMQRQVYATISQYHGPKYDSTPLLNAGVLIRTFMVRYPAAAQQAGLDDALLARLEESQAQAVLVTAKWYLSTDDPVSARYILKRLLFAYPRTSAASDAMRIMTEKGWMELKTPPSVGPAVEPIEPTAPGPDAPPPPPSSPTPAASPASATGSPAAKPFLPGRPLGGNSRGTGTAAAGATPGVAP